MSSDDILTRLTDAYESLCDIGGAWERDVVRDAAAAIRQRDADIATLTAELAAKDDKIKRLRAAGDALAKRLWRGGGDLADMIAAVAAWEEARRER